MECGEQAGYRRLPLEQCHIQEIRIQGGMHNAAFGADPFFLHLYFPQPVQRQLPQNI
jgi:hypothetical protein